MLVTRDEEVGTLDGTTGRGELRSAIEGLLRNCAELDQRSAESGRETRDAAHDVARELAGLNLPGLRGLADEIAGIGTKMETGLVTNLTEARRPFLEEVHQLLALLAPHHGVVETLPPLSVIGGSIRSADTFAEQFPAGFARRYVYDLISSVEHSFTLTVDEPGRIAVVPSEHVDSAIASARDALNETGHELPADEIRHTVEQHGPQIPDEAQLARLIWLKDPTGEEGWHMTPEGGVTTEHWAGVTTGGFTSPEALAKPIDAALAKAKSKGGIDQFLNEKAKNKTKKVYIFVTAEEAGLQPGDASGYQAAGVGTQETFSDWKKSREVGIKDGRNTVHAVPYDPIELGSDPGALVVFKRANTGWKLVTCFPTGKQMEGSRRLEDPV